MPKNEHTYPPHLKDDHTSGTMKIDVIQPSSSTNCEGNAPQLGTKLPQEHGTQHEWPILDHIIRMSNGHNKAEMSAVAEMVIENSGLDKVEEGKSEFVSVSELEPRTPNAKKTGDESVQVEVNIDDIKGLCIVNSETKYVNESKCVRVSKSTYDLQSVTVTEEDPCVIREMVIEDRVLDKVQEGKSEFDSGSELEPRTANAKKTSDELAQFEVNIEEFRSLCVDNSETKNVNESKCVRVSKFANDLQSVIVTEEDPCVTGKNELQVTNMIKANNDISITEPSISDTLMLSFRRSSRNKIPPSRNSDFLW